MKEKNIDTLYSRSGIEFDEMISDMQKLLLKDNKQYKKIFNENSKLKKKYYNLTKVYEDENPENLNKDEINALMTLLNNDLKLKYIELEKMFLLGGKEAYYYFKRMEILKDEDTKN